MCVLHYQLNLMFDAQGHALKFPPLHVWIAVKDNDVQRVLTAGERSQINSKCRQTSLWQFADKLGQGKDQARGLTRSEWLTDYNCLGSRDGGVLPGYPVDATTGDDGAADATRPGDMEAGDGWVSPLTHSPNLRVGDSQVPRSTHLCSGADEACGAARIDDMTTREAVP
jgi:hypothetical protein